MAFSKSLAAFASKVRSKVARRGSSKVATTEISAPFNLSKSMSPVLEQMDDDKLFLIELVNPTAPPRQPTFHIKHKVQLPSAQAEQQHPATLLSAHQQPLDLPSFETRLSSIFNYSYDATSEHSEPKEIPRCSTPSEQLFSPSAPASPNTSSRSNRTPSPIFDSVTSFDEVDSPTLPTITNDHFTELPSRVFPLRRTAPVQRKAVPSSLELPTFTISDPFATLFSGPSPSSSTHSLASLVSFGDQLSLAKDIDSGLVHFGSITDYTPAITSTGLDTLFAGLSPSCSVNSLASLTSAACTSLEEYIVTVGQVGCYSPRALPATPAVEHEGCFAIVEEW